MKSVIPAVPSKRPPGGHAPRHPLFIGVEVRKGKLQFKISGGSAAAAFLAQRLEARVTAERIFHRTHHVRLLGMQTK